jgi:hypothetical protein
MSLMDVTSKAIDLGDGKPVGCCDHLIEQDGKTTLETEFIRIGANRYFALCGDCMARIKADRLGTLAKQAIEAMLKAGALAIRP